MASAAQIAAALADAQAKQSAADTAAAAYTAKVAELAALGGSPRERARALHTEIHTQMLQGMSGIPAAVTTVAANVAADIEKMRVGMSACITAQARWTELAAICQAYPDPTIGATSLSVGTTYCTNDATALDLYRDQTTTAGTSANALNAAVPADASELLRLELLVMQGYYGVGYPGTGYYGMFMSIAGAQAVNDMMIFVNGTDWSSTADILLTYYNTKTTTATTAATAWTYYNSLTLDQATASGTASYTMSGGVATTGTASIPGTTGTGGAVVITVTGAVTGSGGEAAVILASLKAITTSITAESSGGEDAITADLPLITSALNDDTWIPPAQVDGTIDDAPLTLITASVDAETGPVRMIDGDLPLITVSIDALIVPDTVEGTIDAKLTLIESGIEVFLPRSPWIFVPKLTLITSELEGGMYYIRSKLPTVNASLSSFTSGSTRVDAQLSRMRSSITGNFNLKAGLPTLRAQVRAKTGVRAVLTATLPSMTAQIVKGHSIEATLIPVTAALTTAQGTRGAITAKLPVITPTFTRGTSIFSRLPRISADIDVWISMGGHIAAHLPPLTSTITISELTGLPSIDASLNTISANLTNGAGVSTVATTLPMVTAALTGGSGSSGTITGVLTSQRTNLTALQGRVATCTASIPIIVRGRLQAIRGVRGTVAARLTASKAALK